MKIFFFTNLILMNLCDKILLQVIHRLIQIKFNKNRLVNKLKWVILENDY